MPDFNKNDFSGNPVRLDCARSKFSMPFKHKTTFNAGLAIPIFSYGDVLPGDTFKVDMSCLVRMTTPVFPTMDDAYLDVYFFFTPHKLVLSRQMMSPSVSDSNRSWSAFIGAQDSLLNMPAPADVALPFFYTNGRDASNNNIVTQLGSLADYLGVGLTQYHHYVTCLEPLAYYAVWNSYFRDENTMNPVVFGIGTTETSNTNPGINGRAPIQLSGFDGASRWGSSGSYIGNTSSILPVCRPHGYFGSALPWPQRNTSEVTIPVLGSATVVSNDSFLLGTDETHKVTITNDGSGMAELVPDSGSLMPSQQDDLVYMGGLGVNMSAVSGVTVNQLRYLVQTQRWYEALARGGNRIGEMTASMFGVTPSDYAQDRPEYLGGKRIPITMDQVANTAGPSAGGSGQTLGSLGAYSNTGDSAFYFEKSFDTWGTITCVVCVRTNETFSQGFARRYSRKNRLDFYWPQFANLGEQPVLKGELWAPKTSYWNSAEGEVFGYQEAWAEYRYLPDIVSGYLRPSESLGSYTYSNNFASAPTLPGYIDGTKIKDNIDRTLVVPSTTAGFQFIGDFAFNIVATRPMPRYSIPGLVDHH